MKQSEAIPNGAARRAASSEGEPELDLEVRRIKTHAEYEACVALQRDTWGADFGDIVAASILKVSQRVGGISAGAFDAEDNLIGFVFGLTGLDRGRLIHWSHMLAVRKPYRDHGIGRRLKEFQRAELRDTRVEMICWTFDPLVARNAHLNLNRLRARVVEYVPDMYGHTGSELHAFGTDRFVVAWPVDPPASVESPPLRPGGDLAAFPVLNALPGQAGVPRLPPGNGPVRIEIPPDVENIQAVRLSRLPVALDWRASTRAAFLVCIEGGYEVTGFYRDNGRCFYLLSKAGDALRVE